MATRRTVHSGFTLIELLVVIAIILILAAILFPVFAKVRAKAMQTTCVNNLKQMGTAAELYESAFEGLVMPTCSAREYSPGKFDEYKWWPELLDPYLKQMTGKLYEGGTGKIYKCPAAPEEEGYVASWQSERSYGYNWYLGDEKRIITRSNVKYPSSTLRITESWGPLGGSRYAPMPNMVKMNFWQVESPGWHNDASTVLWVDGHVSVMPAAEVMRNDDGAPSGLGQVWCRLMGPKPQN